ncbi:pentapeptide repeat-containing protein [Streptomyces sp. DvalAA-14]|uniref:pentapeptide repeat-containing protein n=1 Tax=Streptomyces sp. DvalAA-14 TaxID=1839759 RepID=UPI0026995AA1
MGVSTAASTGADCSDAARTDAAFTGAAFTGAVFTGAVFTGAVFTGLAVDGLTVAGRSPIACVQRRENQATPTSTQTRMILMSSSRP